MSDKQKNRSVAVIGLGYVGLPLAVLAKKKGYEVTGIDIDLQKVEELKRGKIAFLDDHLSSEFSKYGLAAVTSDFSAVRNADHIIICVPTPVHENKMPDLDPVRSAARSIAPHLRVGHSVVLESTVNPGVSETVVLPLLEKFSGLRAGRDFSLSHCPERINPGDPNWTVENIPRVVGSFDEAGLQKAAEFYESIISAPIKRMRNLAEAEAVKIVENSFRDVNIAFVNELAMSFGRLGIDVVRVIEGAATKPFSFMPHFPGCGVGGHCIPVDPYYLIEYARANGFNHRFLSLAREINEGMPKYTVDIAENSLKEAGLSIKNSVVAVLGLAYKADIDDCRESPAIAIVKELEKRGASVASYDPHVPSMSTAGSLDAAVRKADAVIVATAHKEFKRIKPRFLSERGVNVLVDGRNCLNAESFLNEGIRYRGVGRYSPQSVKHEYPRATASK